MNDLERRAWILGAVLFVGLAVCFLLMAHATLRSIDP